MKEFPPMGFRDMLRKRECGQTYYSLCYFDSRDVDQNGTSKLPGGVCVQYERVPQEVSEVFSRNDIISR